MKQTKTAKELRELERLLTELVETRGCTDGRNLKCTMTYVHNWNTGNTARFQIDFKAANPKRPTETEIKTLLEAIALATNNTIEYVVNEDREMTEARFTHNQLNVANGFTVEQITQTIAEEVLWEDNKYFY